MTRERCLAILALGVFALAAFTTFSRRAEAHGQGTAYLDVVEERAGVALVRWRIPTASREAMPRFSRACKLTEHAPAGNANRSQRQVEMALSCPTSLGGTTVAVDGLGIGASAAVVRIRLADGTESTDVLTRGRPELVVPVGGGGTQIAVSFFRLGVSHIATGIDHLLFVLGLVWLARRGRRVVTTVTAFTVAHSVSLAATSLGWLRVSPAWAETCIALSLVLVALDVGRERTEGRPESHPAWSAGAFGLVHGLGFAGALAEIGLPKGATVTALFAFNLGVEAGQLVFVGACLAIAALVLRFRVAAAPKLASHASLASAYVIGSLGVFFGLARLVALVSGS